MQERSEVPKREKLIAATLLSISPAAYRFVRNFAYLPSESTVRREINETINQRFDDLLNVEHINIILKEWRRAQNIGSTVQLVCVLSVDAVAFTPVVQLRSGGELMGIDPVQSQIDDTERLYELCSADPKLWENWITYSTFNH